MSFMPRCNFSERLVGLADLPRNLEYADALLRRANQLDDCILGYVMDRNRDNLNRMLISWSVAHEAYSTLTGKPLQAD